MAQYTLYTSGPYKQNNGSAITSTSTDVDLGVAKQVRDSENLNRVDNASGGQDPSGVIAGTDVAGNTYEASGETATASSSGSNGFLIIDVADSSDYAVGQSLKLTAGAYTPEETYVRVLSLVSATSIAVNSLLNGTEAANGNLTVSEVSSFNTASNDKIRRDNVKTASDYGRVKVAKFDISPKTTKTATAIRTDKYNSYNGTFDAGYPQTVTDSINADDETVDSTTKIGVKGELTFRSGGANPTSADYRAKTN
jgi:hypothetical protein